MQRKVIPMIMICTLFAWVNRQFRLFPLCPIRPMFPSFCHEWANIRTGIDDAYLSITHPLIIKNLSHYSTWIMLLDEVFLVWTMNRNNRASRIHKHKIPIIFIFSTPQGLITIPKLMVLNTVHHEMLIHPIDILEFFKLIASHLFIYVVKWRVNKMVVK